MLRTKICTLCELEFIANSENFYKVANGKYGFSARCKTCYAKKAIEYKGNSTKTTKPKKVKPKKTKATRVKIEYNSVGDKITQVERERNMRLIKEHYYWYKANKL